MRLGRSLIPAILLCLALTACGQQTPSPEDAQKISALQAELEQVRSEVTAAESKSTSLAGGLVKALVEARLEILKTTEALIQQRIHALESGAKITVEVASTEPNEERAAQLQQEIDSQLAELKRAKQEAAKYDGGLVGAMKEATVATQEQSIAMLRQRYLAAKYGLPGAVLAQGSSQAPGQEIESAQPSTIPSTDIPIPNDVSSEVVVVKLLNKRFAEQEYEEFIWFDIQFTAEGLDKPARAIKGVLNLQDLFGEPKMRINWTIDQPTKPGQTLVEEGTGFEYNQFMDEHKWVRATDLSNMTASFTVRSILYQDGSRRDF